MDASVDQIGSWITAGVASILYGIEKYRAGKQNKKQEIDAETVSDAKKFEERGNLLGKLSEEYKAQFEKEHAEYVHYREKSHEKDNATQAMVFGLQEKIAELQGRPDLTEILQQLKSQAEIMSQLIHLMQQVSEGIHTLLKERK